MDRNRNIPKFDYSAIQFIDELEIVLNTGKEILLGTYEFNGNHVLVLIDKELNIGIQMVSFSRREIYDDYQALHHILSHVNESHKLTLWQHFKLSIKQFIDNLIIKLGFIQI